MHLCIERDQNMQWVVFIPTFCVFWVKVGCTNGCGVCQWGKWAFCEWVCASVVFYVVVFVGIG
jgi:hypothetical protein